MFLERRTHSRANLVRRFNLVSGERKCSGKTRNLSVGGMLARADDNTISIFKEGETVICEINDERKTVAVPCTILRIVGRDIVLHFTDLEFEQDIYLRTLVENNT